MGLAGASTTLWLLLPLPSKGERLQLDLRKLKGFEDSPGEVQCFHLEQGTSRSLGLEREQTAPVSFSFNEITLLVFANKQQDSKDGNGGS